MPTNLGHRQRSFSEILKYHTSVKDDFWKKKKKPSYSRDKAKYGKNCCAPIR